MGAVLLLASGTLYSSAAGAQQREAGIASRNDSISVHLVEADLRAAVQALAPYLDRPVVFGGNVPGTRVTLETPTPVPKTQVPTLLRGLLDSQGLELAVDSGLYRVQAKEQHVAPVAPPVQPQQPPLGSSVVQLFVIHLRHARAVDVAAMVNALYGKASSLGEPNALPAPTLNQQIQATQIPPMPAAMSPAGAVPLSAGRAATLSGDITIIPDPRSNSLLIRASEQDFDLINAAVTQLDTRPLEVLVEVIIAEVQRDRSLGFGIDATLPPSSVNHTKTTVSGSQTGAGLSDFVLRVMQLGSVNIDATLSAAQERGDVRILSRPVVIAANNETATIDVGSQRPFIQVSRSLPTDAATRDEIVQYKDVGTRLSVQPTISPDGYVVLQVTQEVNNATTEVAFNAPVISTRSVQTQLLIKDGQTVVLGGLSDNERDVSQGGIPVLSAIPLLGGLFGHLSRQTTETELFLFITPHVIHTDEDADSVTAPLLERAKEAKP